jgi:transposase
MQTTNVKQNVCQDDGKSNGAGVEPAVTVKLGLDVHAADIVVCRQDGGQIRKPGRRLSWPRFLEWAEELVRSGEKVASCYEAGPCGYGLHRRLEALGIANVVVVPKRWDPGSRVKTDQRDAGELCDALDRYLRGNTKAFSVVRVPTPEQEQRRMIGRQRGRMLQERQRCVLRGYGLMLSQGIQAPAEWWRPGEWEELREQLPAWLREQVGDWQKQAVALEAEVERWSQRVVEQSAGQPIPKGVGALTSALIGMEVLDWSRFQNRRQVGCYTGLCPSEHSSGKQRRQGAITKHGNPRMRHQLVEAVWRLRQWQPDYPPLKKLRLASGSRARRRAVVAAARRLAIDLWRIHTKQCPAEKLGLKLR